MSLSDAQWDAATGFCRSTHKPIASSLLCFVDEVVLLNELFTQVWTNWSHNTNRVPVLDPSQWISGSLNTVFTHTGLYFLYLHNLPAQSDQLFKCSLASQCESALVCQKREFQCGCLYSCAREVAVCSGSSRVKCCLCKVLGKPNRTLENGGFQNWCGGTVGVCRLKLLMFTKLQILNFKKTLLKQREANGWILVDCPFNWLCSYEDTVADVPLDVVFRAILLSCTVCNAAAVWLCSLAVFVSSSLHTQAMGNIYGYGAQQQIPNKDKSFSLCAASLHPHPFLQLVCVTLGRLIAKCCVLPAEDVTRSTVGGLFAQSLRGNYVAV